MPEYGEMLLRALKGEDAVGEWDTLLQTELSTEQRIMALLMRFRCLLKGDYDVESLAAVADHLVETDRSLGGNVLASEDAIPLLEKVDLVYKLVGRMKYQAAAEYDKLAGVRAEIEYLQAVYDRWSYLSPVPLFSTMSGLALAYAYQGSKLDDQASRDYANYLWRTVAATVREEYGPTAADALAEASKFLRPASGQ